MPAARLRSHAWAIIALAALGHVGWAATWTGDGSSDRWSDPANWGGALPLAGEDLVFSGSRRQRSLNDLPANARFRSLIVSGGVDLSGASIALSQGVVGGSQANRVGCAISGESLSISVAAGGSLVLGELSISGDASCEVAGELTVAGSIAGTGGVTKTGPGLLALTAHGTYGGATTVRRGVLRIGAEGACGTGGAPLVIDGGTLELDIATLDRALAIGRRGARLRARGQARTIAAPIATPAQADGLTASFFPQSLRDQRQDDWRKTRTPVGTRREGPLNFPYAAHPLFATADDQRAAGLSVAADGASSYSVQWDGYLAVPLPGTRVSTVTSDGCRVCLDLDHDGVIGPGEWFQDAWGWGHDPPMLAHLGAALVPGVYPLRIQFEQVGLLGGFSLVWDDAAHSAGAVDGRAAVPAEFLTGVGALEVTGDQPLRIDGALTGSAWLVKSGASTLTLGARDALTGRTIVLAGELMCAAPQVLPPRPLMLAQGASLRLAGCAQTIGSLSGAGAIALGGATLRIGADGESSAFTGAIAGDGGLVKTGSGTILLDGETSYAGHTDVEGGTLRRADGTLAVRVALWAPITTIVPLPTPTGGDDRVIEADVLAPADAPRDLGIGAFIVDQHGRWFQRIDPAPLAAGRNHRRFALGPHETLSCQPGLATWSALEAGVAIRAGLFFWSASATGCSLGIEGRVTAVPARPDAVTPRLDELRTDAPALRTGERWSASVSPAPFPADPYDPERFSLEAIVTGPDGRDTTIAGFYEQLMRSSDRGDREEVTPAGAGRFTVRVRPREPGRYRVLMRGRWKDRAVEARLPDLVVAGDPWDGYVRVDHGDPRFFSIGGAVDRPGAFYWPIGMSLRSINDTLSQRSLNTRLTPERGTLSYAAYLERFGASGGDAVEIWMSSWNLALEWRADWHGFHGVGIYNQENAWRLDRVLDAAWKNGVRVNLVLHNHGQASDKDDHEWKNNPYNRELGGPLSSPGQMFTAPAALAGQERLRRYIIARYADHPAVLGWKLWTEINLTSSNPTALRIWHERAAARWHELDSYGHPVTTHWSGDYRAADRAIVALPGIDYVCLDAYHPEQMPLATLLAAGTAALGRAGKPILINEYGANWMGGSEAWMHADHASGAWLALVTGYGGSPMLWWYEWVDQRGGYEPYAAVRAFLAGEDLRGADARSVALETSSVAGALTCLAWQKPGKVLGYVIDQQWGARGMPETEHPAARVFIGAVAAGGITVSWWDADRGAVVRWARIDHPGGDLWLDAPAFSRHIAFKLVRASVAQSHSPP